MISEESVYSSCGAQKGVLDLRECDFSSAAVSQGWEADPINTRTGGFDLPVEDISLRTSAGPLSFQRTYSSKTTDIYTEDLGYGWTHNHDSRLIFSDDPGGQAGFVLFKAHSSNQYRFIDHGDGTYSPMPGVVADLFFDDGYYTVTDGQQNTYSFDEYGVLLTWADPQGHSFVYSYDGNDDLIEISADGGIRYLSLGRDGQRRIQSVTDHAGRSVIFGYDPNGDLVSKIDLLGQIWSYVYDDPNNPHFLTEVVDPRGITESLTEYDLEGRAVRQFDGLSNLLAEISYNEDGTSVFVDALGNSSTHAYNDRKTLVDETDPLGGSLEKIYDPQFRPKAITDQGGHTTELAWSEDGANLTLVEDADGNQTTLEYDALNNLTSVNDPQGHLTSYTYDGTLMTSVTDVFGATTVYTYTPEGWVDTVTDPLGNTTTYGYDTLGQMTSMTDALGNTITYSYDNLGRLVDTTDPLGKMTHNEYDQAGRLVKVTENYNPAFGQNHLFEYNIVTEYTYDQVGNRTSVTDTVGYVTTYSFDSNNRLLMVTDPAGNATTHVYDVNGNRISTTDALGRTTSFVYDALNRLISTTDFLGSTTSTTYNTDGTVDHTTDALGRATYYTYDNLQRVTGTTGPLGGVTSTAYDQLGNVTATTDALGRVTTYQYDAMGRLIRSIDPQGGHTEYFYDLVGNRVQTVDPNGNATTYTYDALGRVVTVTDPQGNMTTYTYNAVGQRVTVVDPLGAVTTYAYDTLGREISVTDPLGNASGTLYDALGRVWIAMDAAGGSTFFNYNSLGQLISQSDAVGGTTSFTYDAVGNQLTVTDANGHTTTTTYDPLNRPVSVTDPNGNTTTSTYNAVGSLVTVQNALNETTTFGYDALNRQTSMTDPHGNSTQYTYDGVGNRTAVTDAKGVVTVFEYDSLNRLTAVVENYKAGFAPDHQTNIRTQYAYDANGNRLTISDGKNNITAFAYNSLNQLVSETDPMGHTWSHTYDQRGLLKTSTDANGITTTFAYDPLGRRIGIDYPGSMEDVTFTYNALGQPLTMVDGVGSTSWTYDSLNRVTSVNDPFGDTVGYDYDAVGNRSGLTYPDGKHVSYAFDPANQLTAVSDWDGRQTQYVYNAAGRILSRTLPNNLVSAFQYDAAGQLLSMVHSTDAEVLSSFAYTYDPVGNRVQAQEMIKSPDPETTVTITLMEEGGLPLSGETVFVYDGETATGLSGITDLAGQTQITLPNGSYRFRAEVEGVSYWSGPANHCPVPGCTNVIITVPKLVLISVLDTAGTARQGLLVEAYSGGINSGISGTTDENGQVFLRLPEGIYRFQTEFLGNVYWSGDVDHCPVPGCTITGVEVISPVVISVVDNLGVAQEGVPVYVYDGNTDTGINGLTDETGLVTLVLPEGSYRFRADFNGVQYWSGPVNHCDVPGCTESQVTVSQPIVVVVEDTDSVPVD